MNPVLQAMKVAREEVQEIEARYSNYHADLVTKLVEVITKQGEGLSEPKRRKEVADIVTTFGRSVAVLGDRIVVGAAAPSNRSGSWPFSLWGPMLPRLTIDLYLLMTTFGIG